MRQPIRRAPSCCADAPVEPTSGGPLLRIGELAARTGVSVKALRQYERLGLVYSAGRTDANYRLFPPEAIACVRAVKLWRGLGFSLKEMARLARLVDGDPPRDPDCQLLVVLERREQELADRIAELEVLRDRIRSFRARHEAKLRRGDGIADRWRAMQEQAREDYRRGDVRGSGSPPRSGA